MHLRGCTQKRIHTVCSEELDWSNKVVSGHRRTRRQRHGYIPTLNLFRGHDAQIANGVWRLLGMPLTINGQSPTPLTFVGHDCATGGWGELHGDVTLSRIAVASEPSYQQAGVYRDGLGYVKLPGSDYYEATGDDSIGQITTQDFVAEVG